MLHSIHPNNEETRIPEWRNPCSLQNIITSERSRCHNHPGKSWTHWCPNGCGKKVYHGYRRNANYWRGKIFVCQKCYAEWKTKKDLKEAQRKAGLI